MKNNQSATSKNWLRNTMEIYRSGISLYLFSLVSPLYPFPHHELGCKSPCSTTSGPKVASSCGIPHVEALSRLNQSLMLLLFCLAYPGIGGRSGIAWSRRSRCCLNVFTVFASLMWCGRMLNRVAPTSLNELQRMVFMFALLAVSFFLLHFGPCLVVW